MEASPEDGEMEERRLAKGRRVDEERTAALARGDGPIDRAYKLLFEQDTDEREVHEGDL